MLDIKHADFLFSLQSKTNPVPWSREETARTLSADTTKAFGVWLGTGLNSELIGFVIFRCVSEEAELIEIGIDLEHRRKGIATKLFNFAIESLSPVNELFLEVRVSNASAIALYSKLGFSVNGTRKGYYKNPVEDALIMKLSGLLPR